MKRIWKLTLKSKKIALTDDIPKFLNTPTPCTTVKSLLTPSSPVVDLFLLQNFEKNPKIKKNKIIQYTSNTNQWDSGRGSALISCLVLRKSWNSYLVSKGRSPKMAMIWFRSRDLWVMRFSVRASIWGLWASMRAKQRSVCSSGIRQSKGLPMMCLMAWSSLLCYAWLCWIFWPSWKAT